MNQTDTNLLAKAYHNIGNSIRFLESIRTGPAHPSAKNLLRQAQSRLEWCIKDLLSSLPPESREVFKKEVMAWDALAYEDVFSEMLLMSPEQRDSLASICKAYRQNQIIVEQA